MDMKRFNELLERRLAQSKDVLASKSAEYSSGADKLHNFKRAAAMLGVSPLEALRGMWVKHLVSVFDYIDDPSKMNSQRLLDEKLGDVINYTILLEGLFTELLQEGTVNGTG